jgi:hypothetical protein
MASGRQKTMGVPVTFALKKITKWQDPECGQSRTRSSGAFSLFSSEFTDTSITNTDRHVLPQNWRFEIRSRVFPGRLVV